MEVIIGSQDLNVKDIFCVACGVGSSRKVQNKKKTLESATFLS